MEQADGFGLGARDGALSNDPDRSRDGDGMERLRRKRCVSSRVEDAAREGQGLIEMAVLVRRLAVLVQVSRLQRECVRVGLVVLAGDVFVHQRIQHRPAGLGERGQEQDPSHPALL